MCTTSMVRDEEREHGAGAGRGHLPGIPVHVRRSISKLVEGGLKDLQRDASASSQGFGVLGSQSVVHVSLLAGFDHAMHLCAIRMKPQSKKKQGISSRFLFLLVSLEHVIRTEISGNSRCLRLSQARDLRAMGPIRIKDGRTHVLVNGTPSVPPLHKSIYVLYKRL